MMASSEHGAADLLADLLAERFGPLNALVAERGRRPTPAPDGPASASLADDEVTIARRRRVLEHALQPAPDAPPAPRRRRRVA